MRDESWSSLRKTSSIINVEYGNTYATLFATDIEVQEGPPLAIRIDLEKNLKARSPGRGTYIDAAELADGKIRQLRVIQLDDDQVIQRLSEKLRHAEDITTPWRLLINLRGRYEFRVEPEYNKTGAHEVLLLHVIGANNRGSAPNSEPQADG